MITRQTINNALALARLHARKKKEEAAQGSSYHDGGASHLTELVNAYIAGTEGAVPEFLQPFMQEAKNMADPDYRTYLELRQKFEGR